MPETKAPEPRYRCHKCYNLNKLESIECTKCHSKRELTEAERLIKIEEEKELALAVAEWGGLSLEDLEDLREDLLDHLSDL